MAETKRQLPGLSVLVVEDNPLIALDLEAILLELGAGEVVTAASTRQAQQLIAAKAFDMAFIDIKLGESTSIPIAEALHTAGVPFAFATGTDPGDIPAELQQYPILLKPYQRSAIDAVWQQLCTMSRKR